MADANATALPAYRVKSVRDLSGQRFGKLLIVSLHSVARRARWRCLCDCGEIKDVLSANLLAGNTVSCGCQKHTVHGLWGKPEYRCWEGMIYRCTSRNATGYEYYGGRGIAVCDRWMCFDNFLADMGPRPSPKHSLDRYPDNDGNYEPGNVRWATDPEQAWNRRKPVLSDESREARKLALRGYARMAYELLNQK